MKVYTIDYKKHYWPDGTVYRQTIKIDKELMDRYNAELDGKYDRIIKHKKDNHIITWYEMDILCYTGKLGKWLNFLKHTGFSILTGLIWELDLDKKYRILSGRNTIVEVL